MSGKTNVLTKQLRQTAVYWGSPSPDGYGGRSFDDPVELSPDNDNGVRWEQRTILFLDTEGQERVSQAVVYVAQDVDMGGYLWQGALDDLTTAQKADPLSLDTAREIRRFEKLPSLDGSRFVRKAVL